ncbi:MAG: S-adenosylmethionine:tRNA ribosyltransferase-isomerase, partial [Deltaproteobacteria bacterium]|nr:S-adenosylmethionine:tRNA ribosyltransferase-isomerase [Deltaproteobacteria bacterium]
MQINDFDYQLSPELIAQFPTPKRDTSRLLVIHREDGRIEHTLFSRIYEYFKAGDV